MKKLLLLVAVVLAFSFSALAQGTSTGTQTGTETKTTTTKKSSKKAAGDTGMAGEKAAGKTSTVQGCLAKDASGSGYTITNRNYPKGAAVKSSEDISAHVGHKVKLTGTWEGTGDSKTFNATGMKHLADTCTAGGKSAKGGEAGASDTGMKKGKKGAKGGSTDTANPK